MTKPWITLLLIGSLVFPGCQKKSKHSPEAIAEALGTDIYIYGYPLVTMAMARSIMTNVASPEGLKAPVGVFANATTIPPSEFHDISAPNPNMLYSFAWLNLTQEPYVLHVPEEAGRFFLMPFLDGWTNVFGAIGTRTTGGVAGDYALVGPFWHGKLPPGLIEFRSPTTIVWIHGRTYTSGSEEDLKTAHLLQQAYSITPLSRFGKSDKNDSASIENPVDPTIDMKTPLREQVNALDAKTYFKMLSTLLKDNPMAPEDAPMQLKMRKIGFTPGVEYDLESQSPSIALALNHVPELALKTIRAEEKTLSRDVNGWMIPANLGHYDTDYLRRAAATYFIFGANVAQDALYCFAEVDDHQDPLEGWQNYRLHFTKEQIPPTDAFWSLSIYNKDFYFPKDTKPLAISSKDPLQYNVDGSLDIYIQRKSPGNEKETNWLATPLTKFIVFMRIYSPQKSALSGTWTPPPIVNQD